MRYPAMVTFLLLAQALGGCHSYEVVTTPVPAYLDAHAGAGQLRVTMVTGERVILRDAYALGDSLFGYLPSDDPDRSWPVALPLGAVDEVRVRKSHPTKLVGFLVGGAVVVGTVAASITLRTAVHP